MSLLARKELMGHFLGKPVFGVSSQPTQLQSLAQGFFYLSVIRGQKPVEFGKKAFG